jgi:Tol biopolymer transport system component
MRFSGRAALTGTLALSVGFAALLAGCSKDSTRIINPPGDTAGNHLVVFSSDRGQSVGQYDLFLYDLDAGGFRLIQGINSASFPDRYPSLSSDGRFIAFQSNRGGSSGSDILLFDRAVPGLISLPGVNTSLNETQPTFSGDALKLAFVQQMGLSLRVRLVNGLTDQLIPLPRLDTTATYNDFAPSPDQTANRIAFCSDRNGNFDVFVYDRGGETLMVLPDLVSDSSDVDPSLSADGRYLCFASSRTGGLGGLDLYLYDLTTRTFVTPLPAGLNTTEDERHPSIGATGAAVAFQSNRSASLGKNDIYLWLLATGAVSQAPGLASVGDDLEPSLRWP